MKSRLKKSIAHTALLALVVASASTNAAAPIQFAGQKSELVISEVSEQMVRLEVLPLDEQGRPRPATPSTILVPFTAMEKFRVRELAGEKEIRAGQLRVTIKPQPLTVSVRRADGKLVQELVFEDGTNSAVTFRTDAPVLGLGEGANQFDRHGFVWRFGRRHLRRDARQDKVTVRGSARPAAAERGIRKRFQTNGGDISCLTVDIDFVGVRIRIDAGEENRIVWEHCCFRE